MLNVEMQTYTYIGSTIVQIYYTILADIVRHRRECQSCYKVVLKTLIQSCSNKIVTKLTYKAVTILLFHDCISLIWNNLLISLIFNNFEQAVRLAPSEKHT